MPGNERPLRVAFIVGAFPVITETFIINQVADLIDAGVSVEVFALRPGMEHGISARYQQYGMQKITRYLYLPQPYWRMLALAVPRLIRMLCFNPKLVWSLFTGPPPGPDLYRSRLLFLVAPLVGRYFDLVHCHFGTVANEYLKLRRIVDHKPRFVTSFYGYDISKVVRETPKEYYDDLKSECALFFVMSSNMRERVIGLGFDPGKVVVHPTSIDVESYPFTKRHLTAGEEIRLSSVGRFVEKKGFDDIVRAIDIVRRNTSRSFRVSFVGGGSEEPRLREMVKTYGLDHLIEFKGFKPVQEVVEILVGSHLFIQPSKTGSDGDME